MQCNKVYIRELSKEDISQKYIDWMNNYEIVKYTESKFMHHTFDSISYFIENCNNRDNCYLFGIFANNGIHIGNIKLDNIHPIYKKADIGLIIGNRDYWGMGIASDVIEKLCEFAFKKLNLHKVYAGIYENNIASLKAFYNAGFDKMYVKKDEGMIDNKLISCIVVERYNDNEI